MGIFLDHIKKNHISFSSLLPEPMGPALDSHFEKHGWQLQAWDTGNAQGYQIYFGAGVQVDNYYEYGFPYLYDKEELLAFAKGFYESRVSEDNIAQEIVDAFGMEKKREYADWKTYSLSRIDCDSVVDTALSSIKGIGVAAGSGYFGLKCFEHSGDRFNLFFEICKFVDDISSQPYFSVYYAVEFDEGDTLFSDWASVDGMDIEVLKKSVFEIANADYSKDIEDVLTPSSSLDAKIHAADDAKRENTPNAHNTNIDLLR